MTEGFSERAAAGRIATLFLVLFTPSLAHAFDPLNAVDGEAGFTSVWREYPSLNARYARIGTPREIAQVRRVAVGQSQGALLAALGRPAYRNSDGSMVFHISLRSTRRDRLVCQYRVSFDGAGKVARAVWRRPQCAKLITG